jgi:beta-glucosidase
VAANNAVAGRLALAAGVDFDLSDGSPFRSLIDQVRKGIVPESEVDQAVARVLTTKFRLGLFDNPYVDPDYAEKMTNGAGHRALALKAAQKVVVLLKNEPLKDGKPLLPLDLTKLKTIAVIGPNAADVHLGGYSREPSDNVKLVDPATQGDSIKAAVEAARKSDVAILVVGENESTNREAWSEQHLGDRDSLDLLGAQNDLVKAVVETGKPTVVLLINGRPLSINYIAEHVPAILEGWYLGQEGGTAAANVLFGDVNPGGKLPITFPHSVGDLPDFYNHKPSANRTYAFSTRTPLFPFGYGLSYTSFKFESLHVEPDHIKVGGTAKVTVDVTNTGAREGDEVPQLYIHQKIATVTRPVMQLKGFQRVTLKPGEKKTVEFTVTPDMLSMLDENMNRIVQPGAFELMVGPSSDQTDKVTLAVTGVNGDTGMPPLPPPPVGSESGVVSTFDNLKVSANYGSWIAISDSMQGGKSTSEIQPVEGGANGSKGALRVTGEVVASQFQYAGVGFGPGSAPMEPANLSKKRAINILGQSDGKTYTVALLTKDLQGMPPMKTFAAGPEWKQYSFPLSAFDSDGGNITSRAFVSSAPGKFEFEIDEVEIK